MDCIVLCRVWVCCIMYVGTVYKCEVDRLYQLLFTQLGHVLDRSCCFRDTCLTCERGKS